jgi:hypothetical protein
MVKIPYVEVAGTMCATSMLMSVYQTERKPSLTVAHQISSLLYTIMKRLIGTN